MDPAALAGLCLLLARGQTAQPLPAGVSCPPPAPSRTAASSTPGRADLAPLVGGAEAREAITRVAFAEAGNQSDSGLAAVVYTIMNRVQDGRWGPSVETVVNARGQFEPVMRAGGDWRRLPASTAAQRTRIDTILNLALDGRLPDLTNGARYFQNPQIVANRALTWQTTDASGEAIVRERVWVTMQPGEIRTCAGCHGENSVNQVNAAEATNKPEALRALLRQWKQATGGGPTLVNGSQPLTPTRNTSATSQPVVAGSAPSTQTLSSAVIEQTRPLTSGTATTPRTARASLTR